MINKKCGHYVRLTVLLGLFTSFSAFALNTTSSIVYRRAQTATSYSIAFGYGTFNLTFSNLPSTVTSFSFDYGSSSYTLPSSGIINSGNASIASITKMNNGLYHYSVIFSSPLKNIATASLNQIPLLTSSAPTKNMPFTDYFGLFQHITVNNTPVIYDNPCLYQACVNPVPNRVLGGYYADWSVYQSSGNYRPQYVDISHLNQLYYAFAALDRTSGQAMMFDPYADVEFSGVNAVPYFALQRLARPYLNIMYSFGGWGDSSLGNYQSGDMSALFACHANLLPDTAKSMVSAITRTGFNGIDVDYEWNAPQRPDNPCQPAQGPQLTQQEADGYVTLLYDLRHSANLPEDFKLTVALPAGKDKIAELNSFKYQGDIAALKGQSDLQILADNVDSIDLMTYDYHGAFDSAKESPYNVTDFLAPMQNATTDPNNQDPTFKDYNISGSLQALTTLLPGLTKQKIVIGVPAYGRIEDTATAITAQNRGVFLPLATVQPGGELGNGIDNYNCLVKNSDCFNAYQPPKFYFEMGPFTNDPIGDYAQTAWAYSTDKNEFISFDSPATAKYKGQFIASNLYGGGFVWELDGDLNPTQDAAIYSPQSVLMNLYRGLAGATK